MNDCNAGSTTLAYLWVWNHTSDLVLGKLAERIALTSAHGQAQVHFVLPLSFSSPWLVDRGDYVFVMNAWSATRCQREERATGGRQHTMFASIL